MPVLPAGVVEHLDVVEDVGLDLIAGSVDPAPEAFTFEELEEVLGDRVVMAVAAPAHAAYPELSFVVVAHEGVLHPDCLAKYAGSSG